MPLEVQPKIVLVLYFVISTLLIVVWRLGLFQYQFRVGGNDQVVVVGSGSDIEKIVNEISSNQNTMLDCVAFVRELRDAPKNYLLIVDPRLGVPPSALDATEVYESLFSRVPLTLVNREAFILATTSRTRRLYDILKRCMDIVLAIILGVVTVWVYPILYVAITAYDRGVFFYTTDRIGKGGARISFSKFRTLTGTDSGTAVLKSKLSVTPLGKFLRISRVDELPQLWSIIRGDLSLIGPRPELPALVDEYRSLIPLYDLRHAVTPGLSGWAQIYHQEHPHHGSNVAETAVKLSYDLYYIKHRSFMLDLDIALKTAKALALRLGA